MIQSFDCASAATTIQSTKHDYKVKLKKKKCIWDIVVILARWLVASVQGYSCPNMAFKCLFYAMKKKIQRSNHITTLLFQKNDLRMGKYMYTHICCDVVNMLQGDTNSWNSLSGFNIKKMWCNSSIFNVNAWECFNFCKVVDRILRSLKPFFKIPIFFLFLFTFFFVLCVTPIHSLLH